jgi:hypothetical protein
VFPLTGAGLSATPEASQKERAVKITTKTAALAVGLFGLALTPIAATAGAQEDRDACISDALTVCGQFIPDRNRIESCLYANRSRISQACQAVLARNQPAVVPATLTDAH